MFNNQFKIWNFLKKNDVKYFNNKLQINPLDIHLSVRFLNMAVSQIAKRKIEFQIPAPDKNSSHTSDNKRHKKR